MTMKIARLLLLTMLPSLAQAASVSFAPNVMESGVTVPQDLRVSTLTATTLVEVGTTTASDGQLLYAKQFTPTNARTLSLFSNSGFDLELRKENGSLFFQEYAYSHGAALVSGFSVNCSRGSEASPNVGCGSGDGYFMGLRGNTDLGSVGSKAAIMLEAAEGWSSTATGTDIAFTVTKIGTTTRRLVADFDENGIIAFANATSNGGITAQGALTGDSLNIFNAASVGGTLDVDGDAAFGSSVTASAYFGDGSHLTGISPSRAVYLGGSGFFTVPDNGHVAHLRMIAGAGGGAASETNPGADGQASSFGDVVASSGIGGNFSGGPTPDGGNGSGSADLRVLGGYGGGPSTSCGGAGGVSYFGGAPPCTPLNSNGVNAPGNSGAGGAAGNGAAPVGSGGSAGEYVETYMSVSPGQVIPYSVGAGGAGGTGVFPGGSGGSGVVMVEVFQ